MTLHDLITLMILLIGTSRTNEIQYMKYTSEYILKLQIHQHSLLTRKVFSRHNLSTQVFFSVSSGSVSSHLHQVWIITGSSSSLDHHQNWNIIKAGSLSKLDHHWIIIKAGSSSSSLLLLSQPNGAISSFFSSQEVLQSHPFFMLVVGLASTQVFILFNTYI